MKISERSLFCAHMLECWIILMALARFSNHLFQRMEDEVQQRKEDEVKQTCSESS